MRQKKRECRNRNTCTKECMCKTCFKTYRCWRLIYEHKYINCYNVPFEFNCEKYEWIRNIKK